MEKLLAEQIFENDLIRGVLKKKALTAPAKRALVRELIDLGVCERRAPKVARMSASAFHYAPRSDRKTALR